MASGKSRKEESNKVTDISKSSSLLKNQEVHILYYLWEELWERNLRGSELGPYFSAWLATINNLQNHYAWVMQNVSPSS